jgi:hypothetical protein
MRYNYVKANFWDHAALKDWDLNTSQIAIYILTCKHRTADGLFYLHPNYIKTDLRLKEEEIESGLEKLADEDFIRWDRENKFILITNALKYQPIDKINYKKAVHEHLINLPKTYLYYDLLKKASRYSPLLKDNLIKSMSKKFINDILKMKINKSKEKAAVVIKDFAFIYMSKDKKKEDSKKIKKNNADKIRSKEPKKITKIKSKREQEKDNKSRNGTQNINDVNIELDGKVRVNPLIDELGVLYFDDKKIFFSAGLEESPDLENNNYELDQNFMIKIKAHKMTLYLIDSIRNKDKLMWLPEPTSNSSQLKSWIEQIEKLFLVGPIDYKKEENMNFSWEEIRQMIDFSQNDEFWKNEINSAKDLRKYAVQLKISMCQ